MHTWEDDNDPTITSTTTLASFPTISARAAGENYATESRVPVLQVLFKNLADDSLGSAMMSPRSSCASACGAMTPPNDEQPEFSGVCDDEFWLHIDDTFGSSSEPRKNDEAPMQPAPIPTPDGAMAVEDEGHDRPPTTYATVSDVFEKLFKEKQLDSLCATHNDFVTDLLQNKIAKPRRDGERIVFEAQALVSSCSDFRQLGNSTSQATNRWSRGDASWDAVTLILRKNKRCGRTILLMEVNGCCVFVSPLPDRPSEGILVDDPTESEGEEGDVAAAPGSSCDEESTAGRHLWVKFVPPGKYLHFLFRTETARVTMQLILTKLKHFPFEKHELPTDDFLRFCFAASIEAAVHSSPKHLDKMRNSFSKFEPLRANRHNLRFLADDGDGDMIPAETSLSRAHVALSGDVAGVGRGEAPVQAETEMAVYVVVPH